MKAKSVMVGIKSGMTLEDFCRKYQCSSEDFDKRLRQIYSHDKRQLRSCVAMIEANRKKPRKKDTEKNTNVVTAVTVTQSGTEEQSSGSKSRRDVLADLAEKEKQLSRHVMDLESKFATLAGTHRSLRASLRKLGDRIDKLMEECRKYQDEFETCLSNNAKVEAQMKETSEEWKAERAVLAETRRQIEELSVVTLSVYASGEISTIDGSSEVELDDSGWESAREELLVMDECQELRLKDIGTLARLLKIVEHLDCKVDVVCDSSELESVFQKLRDRMSA